MNGETNAIFSVYILHYNIKSFYGSSKVFFFSKMGRRAMIIFILTYQIS